MKENFSFKDPLKLHGNVLVQLFDAHTGKLVQEERGHNFIAPQTYRRFQKQAQLSPMMLGKYNVMTDIASDFNNSSPTTGNTSNPFNYMILSNRADAEDPVNEKDILVATYPYVGYGDFASYAGADLKKGSYDYNNCYATDSLLRMTWTFALDRANGTFQSIMLAKALTDSRTGRRPGTFINRLPVRIYNYMCEGGGFYWGNVGANLIYKIDKTTMTEIGTYTLPLVPGAAPILYYNGFIIYQNAGSFYRYEIATSINTLLFTSTNTGYPQSHAMFMIGNFLYVFGDGSNSHLTKIDMTNWSFVYTKRNYPTMGGFSGGTPTIFVVNGETNIYVFNTTPATYWTYNATTNTAVARTNYSEGVDGILSQQTMDYTKIPFQREDGTYFQMWNTRNYPYQTNAQQLTYHLREFVPLTWENASALTYGQLFSRKKLASPVTKTSANTMRITYDISW